MELRHLHSFLALAEELHFGRAAERLGIAQPPLSRHIQQLEAEIGAPLFERGPRVVTLTRAGEELLGRVRVHVEGITLAVSSARAIGSGVQGRLQVGYVSNLSYRLLPATLEQMKVDAPEAIFDLHEMTTDNQLQALRRGEIDVGLVVLPVEGADLMQRTIFRDPLVVVMPVDHALAALDRVSIQQLREFPFIMCPRYQRTGFQHVIYDRCVELGFEPNVVQEVQGKTLLYELIARGNGLSIVPLSSSYGQRPGVVYRAIADAIRPVDIGAVWRKDRDQVLRRIFVDTAAVAAKTVHAPAKPQAVA
ncbi:MAG TPA: LysR substrate-binding domain-containing protein [Opitutaceae bacterium]|nr:LysR substrate-binding domain-containing protein [Opitutaceae bacterium]